MFNKTTLDNKLRIVTKSLPTESVTVLVLVGAGSRYENDTNCGIAHFLEHMFFKGAEKYKNTKEVSMAIDSIGGDFNAFTAKEYAGYFVKTASEHIDVAMDVLSDMLIKATFEPEEIDKERGVILEEYNMYQDTPMYQISWDFEKLVFGDQPLGRDQIGTKELIKTVTREDFQKFKGQLYTPDNTVIAIAGNIDHETAVQKVKQFFEFAPQTKSLEFEPLKENTNPQSIQVTTKQTEQAHLVIGFPSVHYKSEDEYTARLLATILGGNMSSRMFLNVREAQGLCYYVRTATDVFTDAGILATRAGVDTTRVKDAIQAILEQYQLIRDEGITEDELIRAKQYLKGKISLKLEDSEEYAHMLGRQDLLTNQIDLPEDIHQKIEAVTIEDINKYSKKYFTQKNLRLALIGPYSETQEFQEFIDNFN